MYRIGIDIGGTFTDVACVDGAGRVTVAKCASTPRDPSEGLVDGLRLLAEVLGTGLSPLLERTERIVHGTTVATNALLERKGARVGLLTTEGHRDVLEMREGLKDDRYNLRMPPPIPLVPRARRRGVRERMRFDGTVMTPLQRGSLAQALGALARAEVEAVAVCYLHAYRNARHEILTGRALAERLPGVYVSLSSEVLPQIKEYERVWTTVVNAYVGPALARYLTSLAGRLRAHGYRGDVLIMQSHGGVAPVRESARLAAGAVLSGPAGGVAAGRHCVRLLGQGDLITFDMGGTSTDIALLQNGEPRLTGEKTVGVAKVALPSLDIHTLGAGGGSIAWVDGGGILHVGPESAGADPGPACYGKGGTRPTVTDANVVLGLLDPANFLGGRMALHAGAAEAAREGRRRAARHRRGGGGRGDCARGEHQHGGGDQDRLRAARRRSAPLHPGGLRRRRGAAHHRGGPAAGDPARGGAERGRRALGVGHVGHRPALRAGALARERGVAPAAGHRAPALRRPGTGGAPPPRAVLRAHRRPAVTRHALRRADLRDPGLARRPRPGGAGRHGADHGPLPSPPRGALRLQRRAGKRWSW